MRDDANDKTVCREIKAYLWPNSPADQSRQDQGDPLRPDLVGQKGGPGQFQMESGQGQEIAIGLCECGCGRTVLKPHHRFIKNHNFRGISKNLAEILKEKIIQIGKGVALKEKVAIYMSFLQIILIKTKITKY